MKLLVVISIFFLTLSSCETTKPDSRDYFIFGTSYGFCAGDCAVLYIIKNEKLFLDEVDTYGDGASLQFSDTPASAEKYLLAKELLDEFPDFLRNNPNQIFGCPDCADQGGIHIQYNHDGALSSWRIDTDPTKQPDPIRAYIAKLRAIQEELNN